MIQNVSRANSADTVKVGLRFHQMGIDMDAVIAKSTESIHHKDGGIKTYLVSNPAIGFNYIQLTPDTDKVTLQVSAKALGNNYREGIHTGTIEQIADTMNDTGLISITPDILLSADVYRIDANQTLELSRSPKDAVNALAILTAKGYLFRPYTAGIDMRHKAKSRKEQLVCYGKREELLRAKNKDFIARYPKAFTSFTDNSFRIEAPIVKQALMRAIYGINSKEFTLWDLFTADVNPVYQMFQTVSKDYRTIIEKIDTMADSFSEAKDMLLVEAFDYDLNLIMAFVGGKVKGNLSRYKTKYRRLIGTMKAKEGREQGHDTLITEIEQRLSEAV